MLKFLIMIFYRPEFKRKKRIVGKFLYITVIGIVLGACDTRNPASIHAERQGRPTPRPPERQRRVRQVAQEPRRPAPPPVVQPTIRPGKEVLSNPAAVESNLLPVDIAGMVRSRHLKIKESNTPGLALAFDKDTTTLYKSEGINPVILNFTFSKPIPLRAVRIFPSYSTYDWALYTDASEKGLVVRNAADEQWCRVDIPDATETQKVRLEVLRLIRDNYVHLNEVEFYVAAKADSKP